MDLQDGTTTKGGRYIGWGKGGARTFNRFFFKGGGNCHHYWLRKIYFFELGIATGNKLKDATSIVGITKARNKGFYSGVVDLMLTTNKIVTTTYNLYSNTKHYKP